MFIGEYRDHQVRKPVQVLVSQKPVSFNHVLLHQELPKMNILVMHRAHVLTGAFCFKMVNDLL